MAKTPITTTQGPRFRRRGCAQPRLRNVRLFERWDGAV